MLIVSQSGGGQFCLKVNGEYKRTGKAAALPLPGGTAAHDREKEYLLREGENIRRLSTSACSRRTSRLSAPSTASTGR